MKEEPEVSFKKVLIVDAEKNICDLLKTLLSHNGYEVTTTGTAKSGIEFFRAQAFDLIFLDLKLPDMDGADVLELIKNHSPQTAVIIITGYPSFRTAQLALKIGVVQDYITKPFTLESIVISLNRIGNILKLRHEREQLMKGLEKQNVLLADQGKLLEKKVRARTKKLKEVYDALKSTYFDTLKTLAEAIDARDHYTATHSQSVVKIALLIAAKMHLSSREKNIIRQACELHDIGKIAVPDNILNKPQLLRAEEFEIIKIHSVKGEEILRPLSFLQRVATLVRQHHEQWDGKGYPDGLKEKEIDLGARIIAVADVYDAMTSSRVYRERIFNKAEVAEEIKKKSGMQFDPKVVEAFLQIVDGL